MSQSKVSSTDGNTKDYAEYSQVVCAALRFIDEHLHERFTLSDMADQLFLCRSTMVQCFRRETGTSLYAYIIHKRLLRSKELITQGVCPSRLPNSLALATTPRSIVHSGKNLECLPINGKKLIRKTQESSERFSAVSAASSSPEA